MEEFAIGANLESAAARRNEGERLDTLAEFKNFGRQTDGLRRVVSNDAVFDRYLGFHFKLLSKDESIGAIKRGQDTVEAAVPAAFFWQALDTSASTTDAITDFGWKRALPPLRRRRRGRTPSRRRRTFALAVSRQCSRKAVRHPSAYWSMASTRSLGR